MMTTSYFLAIQMTALIALSFSLSGGVSTAAASPSYSGTIGGTFSDPVRVGNLFLNGQPFFLNNNASAITVGFGTSSAGWGNVISGGVRSSVTFSGKAFSNVAPDQIFDLGTLTYVNGVANSNRLIFGFKLNLSADGGITGASSDISVISTVFSSGTFATRQQAADWIELAAFSPSTLNVYEDAQASIELFGKIVGDPQLTLTSFELLPRQENNGFIGQGFPSAVPEPTTIALLSTGLACVILTRRRKQA